MSLRFQGDENEPHYVLRPEYQQNTQEETLIENDASDNNRWVYFSRTLAKAPLCNLPNSKHAKGERTNGSRQRRNNRSRITETQFSSMAQLFQTRNSMNGLWNSTKKTCITPKVDQMFLSMSRNF